MAETAARKQDARAQGRRVDRIDTAPRFTETDAIRLNNLFRGSDTQDMLRRAARPAGRRSCRRVQLRRGKRGAAPPDRADRSGHPVLFLETHKHFPETSPIATNWWRTWG
jgi:phosphoadenosine phosphosulfate reductase